MSHSRGAILGEFRRGNRCVDLWLKRVPGYAKSLGYLYDFIEWLGGYNVRGVDNRFYGLDVLGIVDAQSRLTSREAYEIVDFLSDYIIDFYGTKTTKDFINAMVRSFFIHNRCSLPKDVLKFKGDYPSTPMNFTVEDFKAIMRAVNLLYRSMFLTKFQGMMGVEEVIFFSNEGWAQVEPQIRKGSLWLKSPDRIIIEYPGRKGVSRPFWTSLERDAKEALILLSLSAPTSLVKRLRTDLG